MINNTAATAITWHDAYAQLRQFISLTPSINIRRDTVVIPSEVKEEFYRFFDAARIAFVTEYCPAATECGLELSRQYKALRTKLIEETGLGPIEILGDLGWFLEDPIDGLGRLIFNLLFKLLADQMETAEYEQAASTTINSAYTAMFRDGYQRWVALGIIQQLLPDKSYRFPAMDAIHDVMIGEGHERPGQHVDNVPGAIEVGGLSFEQHPVISFIVPRIALHSRRTSAFVSLHTDFREAEWTARERSLDMGWLDIAALKAEYGLYKVRPDLLKKVWYELDPILPDLALYAAGDINNLALVADFKNMLRPEISLAIMESPDWNEKVKPEDLKRRLLTLRPRQGAFIVCRQEITASAITAYGNEDGLKLIHAGYDEKALEAIVNLISPLSNED
ncbi:MAG: hypothetical protein FWH51_04875 [Dehalococcoidia bacterium]|nr:hypothetical protein [Dehalococcoidia bacterium]